MLHSSAARTSTKRPLGRARAGGIVAILLLAIGSACSGEQPGLFVEINAGPHARVRSVVSIEMQEGFPTPCCLLKAEDSGRYASAQASEDDPRRLTWILEQPLEPTETRRYELLPMPEGRDTRAVVVASDERAIRVHVGDKPVLVYNQAVVEPPDGLPAVFRRSGYIHPLYSPGGRVITGDFAADHPHQHGMFFAWVNTTFEERDIDFWNQRKEQGEIRHARTGPLVTGRVFGEFQTHLEYLDKTAPGGPAHVLDETWTVRIYSLDDAFLIDFESVQRTAGASPLLLNPHPYGGMAIRGSGQWIEASPVSFGTSEGKGRAEGNHTRPYWVRMSGEIDGATAGVVAMASPENFRFPQPVRVHPEYPYFCFPPIVEQAFSIEPGLTYVSRYRFYLYDGEQDDARAQQLWTDYAEPVMARVSAF